MSNQRCVRGKGRKRAIWILIVVMLIGITLLGIFAACEVGNSSHETTENETTHTESESVDTTTEESDPADTEPAETGEEHILSAVAAVEPTCTESGNIAYWSCSHCDKLFGDADGTTEVTAESVAVPAKGHTEVIDEAVEPTYEKTGLTEGKHCSVCDTVLVKQETLDKLESGEYSIIYRDYMGAEIPEDAWVYDSATGVRNLPENLHVDGYKFVGWSDKKQVKKYKSDDDIPNDLTLIDYIPKGTCDDVQLYAHWLIISYSIDYADAPICNNPLTYTVEDEFDLKAPEWAGLLFTHWTDNQSAKVDGIAKGTTGNLVFTANWKTKENAVTSATEPKTISIEFDPELGKVIFVYSLGTIEHVVIDSENNATHKEKGEGRTLRITTTNTIESSEAKNASKTVADSIVHTTGWSSLSTTLHNKSQTLSEEFELGLGTPEALAVQTHVTGKIGVSITESEGWMYEHSSTGGMDIGSNEENTLSSTVAYRKEFSKSIEETYDIPSEMPTGYYRYVSAGNIRVYAVIIYDPATQNYYTDTYSYITDIHNVVLYYRDANDIDHPSVDSLEFDISAEEVLSRVSSSYFVRYDATGGEGKMPISMHSYEKPGPISPVAFENIGTKFSGWSMEGYDGLIKDQSILAAELIPAPVNDITPTITLKAKWVDNMYGIVYDGNGADKGQMKSTTQAFHEEVQLSQNEYQRTGYTFVEWNTKPDGTGAKYMEGQTVSMLTSNEEAITLYAIWKANTYTIIYHPNNGSGSTASSNHTYDEWSTLTANGFYRTGWEFAGWSTYPQGTVSYPKPQNSDEIFVLNLSATDGDEIHLYAVWTLYTAGNSVPNSTEHLVNEDEQYSESVTVNNYFDLVALYQAGYTKATVTVTYDIKYTKCTGKSYINFYMIPVEGSAQFISKSEKVKFTADVLDVSASCTVSVSDLLSNPIVAVEFNASFDASPLSNNEHKVTNIRISISFS